MMNRTQLQPLTIDDIARRAPSALATRPFHAVSSRYTYIPTVDVIEGMAKAGFKPFYATQSRTRIEGKSEFTKHMIRFRADLGAMTVGDSLAEVVLVNSHDGTSTYKLLAGIFRLVCSNGMVVSEGQQESISVRHSGDVIQEVVEGSNRIMERTPKTLDAIRTWGQLRLTGGEQQVLAEAARVVRFGDSEGKVETPITADRLLQARRYSDNGDDLWKTFNRVQENVVRGGVSAMGKDSQGRRRRSTTKEVKGIDQDVRLNRALWQLAERMAELKLAN